MKDNPTELEKLRNLLGIFHVAYTNKSVFSNDDGLSIDNEGILVVRCEHYDGLLELTADFIKEINGNTGLGHLNAVDCFTLIKLFLLRKEK